MWQPRHLVEHLRSSLESVLSDHPNPACVGTIVRLCHILARQHLSAKLNNGTLNTKLLGLNIDDLAFDCIADLFRRDETGRYVVLKRYFEAAELSACDDRMLLSYVRRLVFTRVGDGLFRAYGEADPALAKILRNMKLAVHTFRNLYELEQCGDVCLAPMFCDRNDMLPRFDREELESGLAGCVNGSGQVPEILAQISVFLRGQTIRSRVVPFLTIALVIRSIYTRREIQADTEDQAHQRIFFEELETLVNTVCTRAAREAHERYVARGKADAAVAALYIETIREHIRRRVLEGGREPAALWELFRARVPSMTFDEYRRRHRARLEYCYKLAWDALVRALEREGYLRRERAFSDGHNG